MSKVKIKARGISSKYGVYEYTDSERQSLGEELAQAFRDKKEAELDLKEITAEKKSNIKKLESRAEQLSNDVTTGKRSADWDCLVYLDLRNDQFFKVYESKEHGHEVAAEPFDFAKDQHLFDFETERDDENGVKKVRYEGEVVMTIPYTPQERQMVISLVEKDETAETVERLREKHGHQDLSDEEADELEAQDENEAERQAEEEAEEDEEVPEDDSNVTKNQ